MVSCQFSFELEDASIQVAKKLQDKIGHTVKFAMSYDDCGLGFAQAMEAMPPSRHLQAVEVAVVAVAEAGPGLLRKTLKRRMAALITSH